MHKILIWGEFIGLVLVWFIAAFSLLFFLIGIPLLYGIYTYKIIFYIRKYFPEVEKEHLFEKEDSFFKDWYIPYPLNYLKKDFLVWLDQQDPNKANKLKVDLKRVRFCSILFGIWAIILILCIVIGGILKYFGYYIN